VARGGPRPGSGRKPGEANKRSQEIAAKAQTEGITPLEVMLRAMREHVEVADALRDQAAEAEGAVLTGDADADLPMKLRRASLTAIGEASTLAKDAAPYMHARLAQVNANVNADVRGTLQIVSEFPDADDVADLTG
jgi:hypothetical protein